MTPQRDRCLFDAVPGGWQCLTCGRTVRLDGDTPPAANCRLVGPPPRREPVGTMLAGLIEWFGFRAGTTCRCEERKSELDRRGATWSEEHLDTIVGWLREAHAEQKILIPFIEPAARMLVQRAITLARHRGYNKESRGHGQIGIDQIAYRPTIYPHAE